MDAVELRSRIIALFEAADRDPTLIDRGVLNLVIVGGGPTGVEMAGALADLIAETMSVEYHDLAVSAAQIHLVDLGHVLLGPFSDKAHAYVEKVLTRKDVHLHLGVAVTEVGVGHVTLGDGSKIATRCVVWGGGIMAPEVAAADALPHGHGGRVEVSADLTVEGMEGVYAIGDVANIAGPDGRALPQLGSVALQSGVCAAENILAGLDGAPRRPFRYRDKGIMAMIGRGAALAEVGPRRRELHGLPAFLAWLGVHAVLMTGVRNRIETYIDWGWDYLSRSRGPQVLDRTGMVEIDWGEDIAPQSAPERTTA
jgi:NADH dehydrogenase